VAVVAPLVSPLRMTVNVNAVVLEFPSAFAAEVAAMASVVASSFWIVPVAAAVVIVAGELGLLSVTVNPSSGSIKPSPVTAIVITFVVSPAEKLTVPVAKVPPKSAASAGDPLLPVTAYVAVVAPLVSPLRVTVNVKAVVLLFPSGFAAEVAAIANVVASSFWIVPLAAAVVIVAGALGLLKVTVNPSSGSITPSPVTAIVMTFVVSPAAKLTVPVGRVPPKSAASAGAPLLPVTAYVAVVVPLVSPLRVTVNVKAVVLLFPSGFVADVAAIANVVASSFWIVPVAAAVVIVAGELGLLNVTENPSSGSTTPSPLTAIVMTFVVSPAEKLTVPVGNVPPKSAASAGAPLLPVTV
jgi:ABC-type uncharacterized transport system permease subunit